jgi:hypothetical protein
MKNPYIIRKLIYSYLNEKFGHIIISHHIDGGKLITTIVNATLSIMIWTLKIKNKIEFT